MTDAGEATSCTSCGQQVASTDKFCENCGAVLGAATDASATVQAVADASSSLPKTVVSQAPGASLPCRVCAGQVLDDGFCSVCGARAPSARDHWEEAPADWIGGVCDKGVVHARNEDAMALAGLADRSLAVLVVCDGVTSAPDSDRAALAAARDACAVLVATPPAEGDGMAGIITHWSEALERACTEANAAAVGVARSLGNPTEPPSCTFVAAVLQGSVVTVAWCGDSRAYWLPDDVEPVLLTVDHSLGTEMIRDGIGQAEAEADPTSHTITRWLGADSVDATSDMASHQLDVPGWLLVCSDGLWNYASHALAVQDLVQELIAAGRSDPVDLADGLVRWANDQGGHDNITAALARFEPSLR